METNSTSKKFTSSGTKSTIKIGFIFSVLVWLQSSLYAQSCPNVDFSMGNFTNWQGRTGTCCPINLPTVGFAATRHTIIAAPGTDPNTGGGLVLPAPGFARVARLGNANNGAEAEGLSYTFLVDPTSALFVYTYAVVLEDPGHSPAEQPRFELQVRDQFNNIIPCTFYEVAAGAGLPGFQTFGNVVWSNWTQVGVDLTAYLGQTVTIEARTGDCDLGGHFGYAYLVGQCQPLTINVNFCSGSTTATLTAPGGFANYLWSTGETTQTITINNPTVGQNVSCTVTSVTGCQAILNATLTPVNINANINGQTNVSCFGGNDGTATASPIGGTGPYTYSWAPSGGTNATATGLTAGIYTVTVTESGNGCTATATVNITQPATTVSISGVVTDVNCLGGNTGSIDITVTGGNGGYTYLWNTGSGNEDITNLSAGNYNVIASDNLGCTNTATFTVNQPATAINVNGIATDATCYGGNNGSIDLTVNGGTPGYSFSWSNGSNTEDISGLTAGNYQVTVTDANGCTNNAYIGVVSQPASPLLVAGGTTNVSCYLGSNGVIDITVTGGTGAYTYLWSNGATTEDLTGIPANSYNVLVTDASGCTNNSYSVTITQPASPVTISGMVNNVSCSGGNNGSIDITASGGSGGYTYLWNTGSGLEDLTNLSAGNYWVIASDYLGCTNTTSFTITQPASLVGVTGTATNILCFGGLTGSIDLSPTGGTPPYSFQWNNGALSEDLNNLPAGNYSVLVTDANGCTNNSYNVSLTEPASAISVTGTSTNIPCYGLNNGTINVTISGGTPGYTYAWSNGSMTEDQVNLPPGSYFLTVTDNNGCTYNGFSATISQPLSTLSVNGVVINPSCNGFTNGSINNTTTGGTPPYSFLWTGGMDVEDLINLGSGNYQITVTDANGCTTSADYTLIDPSMLVINSIVNPTTCYNTIDASVTLQVSGGTTPYTYLWNNGQTGSSLNGVLAGNYSVTVTDGGGCSTTASYFIPSTPQLTVDVTTDSLFTIWLGEGVNLNAQANGGTGQLQYSWNPPENLSCTDCSNPLATPTLNTQYGVVVTDENGCTAFDAVYIEILFAMYVPNTFTPNGDGDNDQFFAVSESVKKFNMRIFDRWGEEVFTTTSIYDGWDGFHKGIEAKQDVYVYRIEATFLNGKYQEIIGQVNLIR